jgi:hypothetical protein
VLSSEVPNGVRVYSTLGDFGEYGAVDESAAVEVFEAEGQHPCGYSGDRVGERGVADGASGEGADEVRAVLAGDQFAAQVRRDQQAALRLGTTGVPFVVLAGRYGVPGAGTVQSYADAIRTAWENR